MRKREIKNTYFLLFFGVIILGLLNQMYGNDNNFGENKKTQPKYEWQKVTMDAAFAPRDGAGALVYKDTMWLIGGWNPLKKDKQYFPRITNNEVWYSTDGLTWLLAKPNSFLDDSFDPLQDWEGRHTAGYVTYKGKMWIIGGDSNQKHYHTDVWNSEDGKNWTLISKMVPWAPRVLHHTLVFKDKIWVMGGQTMPAFVKGSEEHFYNDVWNSTDGVHWEKVKTEGAMWAPRGEIGGNAVLNGKMWVLGGGTYDTPTHPKRDYYNDVWSSEDGIHWKQVLENAPWHPRQYHDVAVFDNKLWVLEGSYKDGDSRNNHKDVWYSKDGVNWTELPNTPWKERHAASVFVYDNALWMVVGNNMQSDVWKLVKKENK